MYQKVFHAQYREEKKGVGALVVSGWKGSNAKTIHAYKIARKMKTKERKPKVDYFYVQIYTDSCYPDVARDGWMAFH